MRVVGFFFGFVLLGVIDGGTWAGAVDDRAGVEFFEGRIRPVLVERCYKCHSAQAEKLKGELRVDSREGILKGGENGAAVVPGDVEKSRLIRAIRYGDEDLKMPPKERLSAKVVADFEAWVKMGAPGSASVPRGEAGMVRRDPLTDSGGHWAFQRLVMPRVPAVKNGAWARNEIDRFILAKLEEKGLSPAGAAEKRALIRRATFDLIGLPPTVEEIAAFLADDSAGAFEKVVDRLLSSPHYGERWGRHWLDVVRFGESHGYEQNHLRPTAWQYRDYVIRAFNEDRPYTRFVEEQLAGDVVAKGDASGEAGTGFLVAGVHDTVGISTEEGTRQQRTNDLEDIVSTTGAAFLGLTVGCARCHSHKFDPIPQEDYYRLAAVFAGVRHEERALAPTSQLQQQRIEAAEAQRQIRKVSAQLSDIDIAARAAVLKGQGVDPVPRPAVNTRRNVEDFPAVATKFVRFTILKTRDESEPCIDELEIYAAGGEENLAAASRGGKATASSVLPGNQFHRVEHLNDEKYGNERSWISNERGGGWAQIELAQAADISRVVWSRDNVQTPRYNDRLAVEYRIEVSRDGVKWRTVSTGEDRAAAVEAIPFGKLEQAMTAEQRGRRAAMAEQLEKLRQKAAIMEPARAYVGAFTEPDLIYLLKRGDVMQRGEVVGPAGLSRIPKMASGLKIEAGLGEAGRRLGLARWICGDAARLSARVIVNRVWQYHFGRGMVSTPSDFGAMGDKPSHPELLDWLASDFVANGWHIKRLHRQIMLSSTYQQSSKADPAGHSVDADNRLLWHMPPRRLEAEAIRDSILAVSGKLDLRMGGPGFQLFKYRVVNVAIYETLEEPGPLTWRRAVYRQTARSIHDDLLGGFDEPESAQRFPRRDVTTTPLQALTMLNSPFVLRQAEFFAERVKHDAGDDAGVCVERAFLLAFGRSPRAEEREAAVEFARRDGLVALCRVMFNANEFLCN
jgi:cytochrome c553